MTRIFLPVLLATLSPTLAAAQYADPPDEPVVVGVPDGYPSQPQPRTGPDSVPD